MAVLIIFSEAAPANGVDTAFYIFTVVSLPSGASDRKVVWVQVPSPAPKPVFTGFFFCLKILHPSAYEQQKGTVVSSPYPSHTKQSEDNILIYFYVIKGADQSLRPCFCPVFVRRTVNAHDTSIPYISL